MPDYGLGRRHSLDERDLKFPMAALVEEAPEPDRTFRNWWTGGFWGNQKHTPRCVAYSLIHWAEDGPHTLPPRRPGARTVLDAGDLYHEAQKIDEWPGTDYDGTSVRAGAKVLQREGYIESYHWAWDVETVVRTILTVGPVVVGSRWYSDMFTPDDEGIVRVGGSPAGGHAYKVDGVNTKTGLLRIKNSWGRGWGRRGFANIPIEDMRRLLKENGEACVPKPISGS